jgi:cysteine desulfurase/selenocysteine lyase
MDVPAIRKDFPVLQGDDAPIFFDSACTTLRPAQVLNAMSEYYEKYPSCGGRSIHKFGTRVTLRRSIASSTRRGERRLCS